MALRRVNQRVFRTAVKAQLEGLSRMAGKQPEPYGAHIPVEREPRKPSKKRRERNVNDEIREWQDGQDFVTLYRNNRGAIQTGKGWIRYGVGPNGASDWLGWVSLIITPEMVGMRVAIFTAVEAKKDGEDADENQDKFIKLVLAAGGRAGVARSAEDAEGIIA